MNEEKVRHVAQQIVEMTSEEILFLHQLLGEDYGEFGGPGGVTEPRDPLFPVGGLTAEAETGYDGFTS